MKCHCGHWIPACVPPLRDGLGIALWGGGDAFDALVAMKGSVQALGAWDTPNLALQGDLSRAGVSWQVRDSLWAESGLCDHTVPGGAELWRD